MRVGQDVVPLRAPQLGKAVMVGLGGGYVCSRHRQEARHFEVIAGRVFNANGNPSRFVFVCNGPTKAGDTFELALAVTGGQADTPATVLCDGDAGLWRLQRKNYLGQQWCWIGGTRPCALLTSR